MVLSQDVVARYLSFREKDTDVTKELCASNMQSCSQRIWHLNKSKIWGDFTVKGFKWQLKTHFIPPYIRSQLNRLRIKQSEKTLSKWRNLVKVNPLTTGPVTTGIGCFWLGLGKPHKLLNVRSWLQQLKRVFKHVRISLKTEMKQFKAINMLDNPIIDFCLH